MWRLGLEAGRQRGLNQKGAHDVIRRANHPLNLAVLGRDIRTRHTQLNTPREEERMGGGVVKLTSVVTLDGLNGEAEDTQAKKWRRVGKVSDLACKGKVQEK